MDDISLFYFTNMLLPPVARFSICPQSGFKESYVDITEDGLIEALGPNDEMKAYLKDVFGVEDSKVTMGELRDAAIAQKGIAISKLLFSLTMDEEDEVLRQQKRGYRATAGPLYSGKRYVLEGTLRTNGQTLQLMALDISKQKPKRSKISIQGVDRLLDNVENVFPDVEAVKEYFTNPENVTIVGIDLGEVCTAAACCINFSDKTAGTVNHTSNYPDDECTALNKTNAVRNLVIKRQALYQPTLKARVMIEKHKPAEVCKSENSIPGRKEGTLSAACEYAVKVLAALPAACRFYSSTRFKRTIHDSKKARRCEYDVATNGILRMVGGHVGRKKEANEDVLFAIGLGDFNTRTQLSSLHRSFAIYLILKVRQSLVRHISFTII